jgi:hypothetical protein
MKISKSILILIFLLSVNLNTFSQKSIQQEENKHYRSYSFKSEKEWDKFNNLKPYKKQKSYGAKNTDLTKIVFGWNPYWMGTAYKYFDYSLLSDVSYFSYEVDPNTGLPSDLHYWLTTELVDSAHANNCRVSLTVTLFSGHAAFFASSSSKQTLIDTVISLVQYRNADGVNLDIEGVPSDQSSQLTAFVQNFCTQFHNAFPNGKVSIDLPAVNWSDKFDVANMVNYIDLFLIMGYDYHWSGSEEAGPVAPKNNGELWTAYDVTRSINYYLNKGIPPEKLALAVPYYGRDWSTNSSAVPSSTTGSSSSKTYKTVREEMSNYEHHWDMNASVPYITYQDAGKWHQCWYDNEFSLADKYDLVKMKNLAGIGIWALGYDGDYPNLWEMLSEKFRTGGAKFGYGVFTDMGGPRGNYYNNDDYVFTISPAGATEIKLVFDEFSTDVNDVLTIYDGDLASGIVLATYSGTPNVSDTLTAGSGIMSFHFSSDDATVSSGWYARWANTDYVLGISENTIDIQSFKLFPNPVKDKLWIEINMVKSSVLNIQVLDITGNQVISKITKMKQGNNRLDLSNWIANLKNGNYFIRVNSEIYSITKKIIIVR